MIKKLVNIMFVTALIFAIGVTCAFAAASDVKSSDWHYATTTKVMDKGIMKGYPDGAFKPNGTITKAEFITTVVKIVTGGDAEQSGDFWARSYIEKARELGITDIEAESADDSQAAWNKPITRQEMAVMITKATMALDEEEKDISGYKATFKDYADICDYCKDYVLQAYAKGIISGYSDKTFKPVKTATRAEAGVMLVRLDDPSARIDLSKVQDIDGILFNPETDIRPDGMMTEEKAMQFMDKTLATIKFYTGSDGKYYVTGTLPELPEGFVNGFYVAVLLKDKPAFMIKTGQTMNEDAKISSTGTFTREITGMNSLSDLNYVDVIFGIDNANGDAYADYAFGTQSNGTIENVLYINHNTDDGSTLKTYDAARHFVWK